MNSTAISSCMNERAPVRATYVNLYKWPESDVEFVKKIARKSNNTGHREYQRVVDSYSCRQMYLRSYTFSRKETMPEKTRKCLGKMKNKVCRRGTVESRKSTVKKASERLVPQSCGSLRSIFFKLLSCTTKIDVVDPLMPTWRFELE